MKMFKIFLKLCLFLYFFLLEINNPYCDFKDIMKNICYAKLFYEDFFVKLETCGSHKMNHIRFIFVSH